MRKLVKRMVDVSMPALMMYLMSYQSIRGLFWHARAGIALFLLFFIHHALNAKWYTTLAKGTCTFRRVVVTASNFLLTGVMVVMMLSSLMMSGGVFAFVSIPMTEIGRKLHVTSTAWGYLLMAFHTGLHITMIIHRMYKRIRGTHFSFLYYAGYALCIGLGVISFQQSGLANDLVMHNDSFNPTPSPWGFFVRLFAIFIAMCLLTHLLFQ
ncbi:MAG: hypothetical protein ACQ5SW_04450, partial [Sphaerochaetaceae bacterium]